MKHHLENIREKLTKREELDALRSLPQASDDLIDFCSNDYLGFAREQHIHGIDIEQHQFGATGSRLISGNHLHFERTESYLAENYNADSALLFNSGYDANLGFFASVPQRGDTIVYDELIHASIRDGIRLSYANSYSFQHNDLIDFKTKLDRSKGKVFAVVESVYSMDGDLAPIKEMIEICKASQVALIVDEAHALGTRAEGKGLVCELKLEHAVFARIITFGKAMGCHGAAVLGDHLLKEYLVNFCRTFIYTTAMPISGVRAIENAHHYLNIHADLIKVLAQKIALFKDQLKIKEGALIQSESPIQCIVIPGNAKVKEVSQLLLEKGFNVKPILSPTVPQGKERLRVCLHVFNSDDEIRQLVNALNTCI